MKKLFLRFGWVLGVFAFVALFGFVAMLLWNWLLPPLMGLPEITFLQGLGLLALGRILFGGLGGSGRMFAGAAHHHRDPGARNHFRDHWNKMTDEERKEFIRRRSPFDAKVNEHIFERFMSDEEQEAFIRRRPGDAPAKEHPRAGSAGDGEPESHTDNE
jgi:hypothetical protein